MSKRKHKNRFRFQPHTAPAATEQTQLPLPSVATARIEAEHASVRESEAAVPAPIESDPVATVEPAPQPEIRLSHAPVALDASLGQRLRAAREARGLSCEAVSHTLKLPVTIIKALEAEQFERIGHGVFLRGYLSKYLQLLDLPQVLAERVVQDHAEPPPLTTNGTISHPRYLFERYSGSALYLILTGVIVVPAVLVALRVGLDQNLARIAPLDAPPLAVAVPAASLGAKPAASSAPVAQSFAATTAAKPEEAPLVASMTPFPAATENKQTAILTPVAAAMNRVHLSLSQPSWIEVVDANGKKLEYGLLPAGSERNYASDLALDIRIGNAEGASLTIQDKQQDLSSYRHANVAHLRVSDGAAAAVHGNG